MLLSFLNVKPKIATTALTTVNQNLLYVHSFIVCVVAKLLIVLDERVKVLLKPRRGADRYVALGSCCCVY